MSDEKDRDIQPVPPLVTKAILKIEVEFNSAIPGEIAEEIMQELWRVAGDANLSVVTDPRLAEDFTAKMRSFVGFQA